MAFDKLECFGNCHEIVHIVLIAHISTRFKQVSVLYFAKSAELTGLKAENIIVPSNITSLQLWQDLENRHPRWIIINVTLYNYINTFVGPFWISDIYTASDALYSNRCDTLPFSPPIRDLVNFTYWHCYYI